MTSKTLIKMIELLPDDDQQQVENMIQALLKKRNINSITTSEGQNEPNERKPIFGSGKGMFGEMSDDFDEPLEDFKDYM
ncbi:MAG: DUF2281 domain-containing protein [Mucilaginibacter sp.]